MKPHIEGSKSHVPGIQMHTKGIGNYNYSLILLSPFILVSHNSHNILSSYGIMSCLFYSELSANHFLVIKKKKKKKKEKKKKGKKNLQCKPFTCSSLITQASILPFYVLNQHLKLPFPMQTWIAKFFNQTISLFIINIQHFNINSQRKDCQSLLPHI